jgi:hypothetical protein
MDKLLKQPAGLDTDDPKVDISHVRILLGFLDDVIQATPGNRKTKTTAMPISATDHGNICDRDVSMVVRPTTGRRSGAPFPADTYSCLSNHMRMA